MSIVSIRSCVAAACAGALVLLPAPAARAGSGAADSAAALDRALRRTGEEIARTTELYEDHSTWEKAWIVETDHYSVRTIESRFLAADIAAGLEVMLGHFLETLELKEAPARRAAIQIVPDVATYNRLGASYDQHSSFYGSFFADQDPARPVIAVYDANPTLLRMQITHGAVHQFLAAEFPNRTWPTWIGEGLAAYFSIYWDYDWGLDEFERVRKDGNLVPLPRLFKEEIAAYATRPHAHMMELGMLFYYLLRFRDDTRTTLPEEEQQRGPFRDYLLATLRGQETSRLPVAALLRDPTKLDEEFDRFQFPR